MLKPSAPSTLVSVAPLMPRTTYNPDISTDPGLATPSGRECSTQTRDEQITGWQLPKQREDAMEAAY